MDPNQYNNNSYNGGYGGQGFNQPTYGQQDFIQQGGSNQDFYNPVQNTGSTYYGGNQHQATYGAPQPTEQYGGYNQYNQYSQTQYAPPPLPTYDQSQATNQGYGQQTQGYGGQGYNNYNQPQGGYSAAPANTTTEHFTYAGASDWKDSNDHKYSKNAPAVSADYLEGILQACINEQNIQAFYPNPGHIREMAQSISSSGKLPKLAKQYGLPLEMICDLSKLCLFDNVVLADDSGSMDSVNAKTKVKRTDELKDVVAMVAQAACLFDTDGVDIRFLNSNKEAKFHNVDEARAIIDRCKFLYATPLATSLFNKILTPMLIKPAEQGTLQKPLHVIVITDGEPCHDEMNLSEVISKTKAILDKTRYTADAVSYQFAQVGDDEGAHDFLKNLDKDRKIGSLIDQTMGFEFEKKEMWNENKIDLTVPMWQVKIMLGAIDKSYDFQDEPPSKTLY